MDELKIIGAGGHAKVVIDALPVNALLDCVVYDLNPKFSELMGVEVKRYKDLSELNPSKIHIALGNNATREKCIHALQNLGFELTSICHQLAIISRYAVINAGAFVAAQAILAPYVTLGFGVIVNHAAVVDHDVEVGEFTHIAPGVTIGGEAVIGKRCLLGAGANILPGIKIGDDVTVGAGAVVTKNIPTGATVVGIPAKSTSV